MFDLRIPASMAALPGRMHACWDDADDTPTVKLPKPRTIHTKREKDRAYYIKNARKIAAQRKARRDAVREAKR